MSRLSCTSRLARVAGLSLLSVVALVACSPADRLAADPEIAHPEASIDTGTASLPAAISDLRQPRPGLYTAGQPAAAAWQVAADNGITTVINLRPMAEMDGRDEAAEVAAAGLGYFELPVAGAGDVTIDNARRLEDLIAQAPGPVLVHCASGNRVGALLALAEVDVRGAEQALAFGRSAGLGSLESRVRQVIDGAPVTGCEADASC